MSKVLFVHDGIMFFDINEEKYLTIHYKNKVIDRYSYFGNRVTFLMRKSEIISDNSNKYSVIDHPSFQFIGIPNFKSILTYHKKREAKKIIEKAVKKHDVVIVRLPSAAGTIAFKYAKKYNKAVLVECVACVYDALWNYNWKGKFLAHYKYFQNRQLMKQASHTIYVTNEFLQSRYPTNGKSIGCSDVVLKEFDEGMLSRRFQKIKRREKNQPLVLGTVAALNVPYKGQADVIRAVGKLKKQGVNVIYKLVGQGDSSRLLKAISEAEVEDRVEIVGPLPHDKVFDFLDEIDVYIQPSRQEGLPRAMIEALSRGCLVTGANTAGIPELIEGEFVFDAGNLGEINSILQSLNEDVLLKQAKRNFSEAGKFREDHLDKKRIEFYEQFKKDYSLK